MATGNPGGQGGPRQGGDNGGVLQGMRDQVRDAGQRVQEGVGQVGERVQQGYEEARRRAAYGYRQAEGMIARNPGQSVLVGFGVGFGLGMLLTVLLTQAEDEPWYERYLPDMPDSLRRLPDRLRHLHVREAVERYIPESLKR